MKVIQSLALLMATRYCNENDTKDAVRKLHNYRIRLRVMLCCLS